MTFGSTRSSGRTRSSVSRVRRAEEQRTSSGSMPRSAIALPMSGASVTPRVASDRSLTAFGARGKAHGFVRGLEQGARLAHAFGLLALRHRVGDDARAGPHIHGAVLYHRGSEYDAAIHLAAGGEISHTARIRSARLILKLVDDLHGAHFGRSRHGAGRKARHQRIDRIEVGSERPLDIRNDMDDLAVIFEEEAVGNA